MRFWPTPIHVCDHDLFNMNQETRQISFIKDAIGGDCVIESCEEVSGGCINSAQKITLDDGSRFFLKQNRGELISMFETEAIGLSALAQTTRVNVPSPIHYAVVEDSAFLLMEWIEPQRPDELSLNKLGEMLANLHLFQQSERFGFAVDNFLGSSRQYNSWRHSWPEFFISQRLETQVALARENGFSLPSFNSDELWARIEKLLESESKPSLIHGDLWSGNYMIGPQGKPFLIDPAPYWAHREAEFGILTLFGGFDRCFFEAYHSILPREDGFEERLKVYQLYHYLNHLNLFGASYLGNCERLLKQI